MAGKRCKQCGEIRPIGEYPLDARYKKKKVYKAVCASCADALKENASRKRQPGLPWQQDPVILQRLTLVNAMMIEGAKSYQIAHSMGYSHDTATLDMKRVEELRREEAQYDIQKKRSRSVANYRYTQTKLWSDLAKTTDAKVRAQLYAQIIAAESKIVELEGTRAPTQVNVTAIPLSLEAQLAMKELEATGISPASIYQEFEAFLLDLAKEKVLVLEGQADYVDPD